MYSALGHGAGAVGAVGQVQDGLGLGVQQVGLHRGLEMPLAVYRSPLEFHKLSAELAASAVAASSSTPPSRRTLFDSSEVLDGVGGQLADVVGAVGVPRR